MNVNGSLFKCPYGHVSVSHTAPQTIPNGTVETVQCSICGRKFETQVHVDTFQLESCQEIGGKWSGALEFIRIDADLRDLLVKASMLYPDGVIVMCNRNSQTLALFVPGSCAGDSDTSKLAPCYWSTDIHRQWSAQYGEIAPSEVSKVSPYGF